MKIQKSLNATISKISEKAIIIEIISSQANGIVDNEVLKEKEKQEQLNDLMATTVDFNDELSKKIEEYYKADGDAKASN